MWFIIPHNRNKRKANRLEHSGTVFKLAWQITALRLMFRREGSAVSFLMGLANAIPDCEILDSLKILC